ncbi:hypothetical protein NQ152_02635 [Microbacterium sp. zg.B48]|uniref:hypothetical protein n=1 Tax=Microbacterium sp. zg.B48 TaxID=2969408 RepID=UPI00214C5D82|nr:hypothetical protein [Microbacterium sp. zg.B48]MCR2762400.1 hypothetical protein [Microbacterium sp. zg.B48]
MTQRITDHYQLDGEVPFVDVLIDEDNLLFVDMLAIRLSSGPEPYRATAIAAADSFLAEITGCVLDGSRAATARGRDLLAGFREPWETRFGMSEIGFFGRGGASSIGVSIWEAISTDLQALVEVGMLRRLEHLPVFVEGLGADICSDVTTRVIYAALAEFTREMMVAYPELQREVVEVRAKMWDSSRGEWAYRSVTLPAPEGRALLLVPKQWGRRNPLVTAPRFHNVTALGFVQEAESRYSPTTKQLIKTPKHELARRSDLRPVHESNIRLTLHALQGQADLLDVFDAYVSAWLRDQERVA